MPVSANTSIDDAVFGVSQSLNGRAWRLRPAAPWAAGAIAQQLNVPEVIARVLAGRGLDVDNAADFLNPTLKAALPDPLCVRDMEAAAVRIADAIEWGETVAVFGDYDVDGATSAALLMRFFRAVGGNLIPYIPDRLTEGYGPNTPALLRLRDQGASLVITVDCGTLAYEPLAAARAAGLDVVVVDHHLAEPGLPQAVAIINPNRLDDDSGLTQLAAVGVAFMLVVAVNRILRQRGWYGNARPEPELLQWLDLVALGTVADVVPLTGLNRALVAQGLKVLAQTRNAGLKALIKVARLDEAPTAYHLGFLLGPRVNAGGRVGEADLGVRLLTTDDDMVAAELAQSLDRYNQERQAIEAQVQNDALAHLGARHGADVPPPLVFAAAQGWHVGVLGIVASRLKEKFDLPAVVIGLDGEVGKGSARSIPGVDIGAAMTAAKQAGLLVNGGGHKMAAGLTVQAENVDALADFLRARLAGAVAAARVNAGLTLDGVLTASGANIDLVDTLERMGPFGTGNPTPKFGFAGLKVAFADVVGSDHVRVAFEGAGGQRLKGVAFRSAATPLGQALLGGMGRRFHVAGSLKRNAWNGRMSVDLMIDDAAAAD